MTTSFELMDLDSGNLVGSYRTLEEALEVIRNAYATYGLSGIDDLGLARVESSGSQECIAIGPELVRYAGMRADRDVLQFDCALSYGLVEYLRTLDMLDEHGWSRRTVVPHGGHQISLNMAAGLGLGGNESYPGVFQPFGGFADTIPVENGYVALPDAPGIGFELKAPLYAVMRELGA